MDKAVFLFDKEHYTQQEVNKLTRKDCEEYVAEETYEDNYTIIKIDANSYSTSKEAINEECLNEEYYHIKSFGF